jgi:hypothetical protein
MSAIAILQQLRAGWPARNYQPSDDCQYRSFYGNKPHYVRRLENEPVNNQIE